MSGFSMRVLGKTGLQVSPLGIGGGQGISSEDLLYAFDRGINYFFYSSDLHHFSYQKSADAIRVLCQQGSAVRDKVVLATVTYVDNPEKLPSILIDQFTELGLDYIDIFHWGWITDTSDMLQLLKKAHQLKGASTYTKLIRQLQIMNQTQNELVEHMNDELLKRGLVRFVGASFHSRAAARTWMRNLDVLMVRYNIAHTGAEQDIVPFLYRDKGRNPGVVTFNVGHSGIRSFHNPLPGYTGQFLPSVPDCYRFALTNTWVDLVLTGPSNREEIDLALDALEKGPMSDQECEMMRNYGALYKPLQNYPAGLTIG